MFWNMERLVLGLVGVLALVSVGDAVCVPGVVQNVTLDSNNTLTWSPALNPIKCRITTYVINVLDDEQNIKYEYTCGTNCISFNFQFLDFCKPYSFEVHALTNDSVLGPSIKYKATIAPKRDVDLSLKSIAAISTERVFNISWDLKMPNISRCISYYRVVYWDENNKPTDVYVPSNIFTLKNDISCMNYTFQVNAIIANPDIQGPIEEIKLLGYKKAPSVPSLVSLTTTNSSVTMIWKLESYSINRCTLTALAVSTTGVSSNMTSVRIPIVDNVLRPNVKVTLTGLTPDDVYMSDISVYNNAGYSKNVTVSYQTKDSFEFNREINLM